MFLPTNPLAPVISIFSIAILFSEFEISEITHVEEGCDDYTNPNNIYRQFFVEYKVKKWNL